MQRLIPFPVRTLSPLILILFTLVLTFCLGFTPRAQAATDPGELAKAVEAIENLDLLRHGLASSLESMTEAPTGETFKAVCKPVGMQAKQLSQENGWQVKQIASKYRNPDHAPDSATAERALERFSADPQLYGYWDRETLNGVEGTRYYRRINVEATCLTCHGAKENRPDFVKANYPQDLAYNFEVGDLRGMYAVLIPDLQAELAAANQ